MSDLDTTLRHAGDIEIARYADELAQELALTAAEVDQSGAFPHAHFAFLRERGALTLTLPSELGGQGQSLYGLLLFQERLGSGSAATALTLGWHLMAFAYLSFDLKWSRANFEQLCRDVVEKGHLINILVTEREGGNLLRGGRPTTVAKRVDGGYRLRGQKAFCSGAPEIRQAVVYAWIEEQQRTGEFIVPIHEQVRIIPSWNTLGMRGTGSHDIAFDDVFVPASALANTIEPGKASSFTTGSRVFGLQIAAVYLGVAQAARRFALQFAAAHPASNAPGVILDLPQVQQRIGEIEYQIGAAKNLLYGLADRWERYEHIRHRLDNEVGIVKSVVTNHAANVVDLAMKIVGGHSLSRELPLERLLRDVRCGLFNPPHDDMVLSRLAQDAASNIRQSLSTQSGEVVNIIAQQTEPVAVPV
ncbi:alkylation response protein AidB-like acyl-CoA dehydrogenase [Herbaspirillum sp. Sphag1AN]|uniref:acyl-CoA dehydrogenase family protein n=1 Tax=unclassified Herbaspirillum TaxID=2624150 RepID=UPI00161DF0E9|nr:MULTISPECIES: acyl-CoA dehydrogenase family protein [unclassified Herbaspirillum]MBB3211628.1 alkylation response protein AidB-like acyl-CoA dehydrogenase [Herbaspirillum sp. Sphag1AN]MBB3245104.1 alkylation response protein AidB-like acyl-CoA dehydrogenase [Herbaspirillum sp. Sphag64]